MNKTKLMFAAIAACVALAACTKKDFNAITGTDTSTSVGAFERSDLVHIVDGVDTRRHLRRWRHSSRRAS